MKLFVDGAARGNPGPAGVGVVLQDDDDTLILEISEFIGETTNNVAEYSALLRGLREAEKLCPDSLTVYTDSELMARQLLGEYRVRTEHLIPMYAEAKERLSQFPDARICHVMREFNRNADRLARKGVEKQRV